MQGGIGVLGHLRGVASRSPAFQLTLPHPRQADPHDLPSRQARTTPRSWPSSNRGRDTIRLRETPDNLSGSGSETHQHFSPADANSCQSLLLDPDATISIDLHKRLFLLVTG